MAIETFEQYKELRQRGLSIEQILNMEKTGGRPQIREPIPASEVPGRALAAAPRSAARLIGGVAEAIAHPIRTAQAITGIAAGGVEKLISGEQPQEKMFDALIDIYKERYGSFENIKQTISEDPIGFLADTSVALGITGKVARVPAISQAAGAVDPLAQTTRLLGKGVEKATAGRTVKIPRAQPLEAVREAEARLGVTLPASAKTTSRVVPVIEALEGKSILGGRIMDLIDRTRSSLVRISDKMVKSMGETDDLSQVGEKIIGGMDDYRGAWIKEKNKLYEAAERTLREPIEMQAPKSTAFLERVITRKRLAEEATAAPTQIKFFEEQLDKLTRKPKEPAPLPVQEGVIQLEEIIPKERKPLTIQEMRAGLIELNEKVKVSTDPIVTGNKATLRKLAAQMSDDLDEAVKVNAPQYSKAIDTANSFYKKGLEKMNTAYGKKIVKFANQPDKIIPAILNSNTSIEDIPKIFEIMGKENVSDVKSVILRRIFEKAKGTEGTFTPSGLVKEMERWGDAKLNVIFTPEEFQKLKDIRVVAQSFARLTKVTEGSQTAFLGRLVAEFTGFFFNPVLALKIFLGDVALNKFVNSKIGQQFLTEGVTMTGRTGQKIQQAAPVVGKVLTPVSRIGAVSEEIGE